MRVVLTLVLAAFLAAASRPGLAGRAKGATPVDVVGTYSVSHPFWSSSITFQKDGTFTTVSHACTGSSNSKGSYVVKDGVVETTTEAVTQTPNGGEAEAVFPAKDAAGDASGRKHVARYRPVAWGERLYLVGEGGMAAFCSAINAGAEPRGEGATDESPYMEFEGASFGSFYLRDGDERKAVSGPPLIPEEWQSYLLKQPARGVVLDVESDGTATISAGAAQGLKVGMVLGARGETSRWINLEVVSVDEKTAKVKPSDWVTLGTKVSTRYEPPKRPE